MEEAIQHVGGARVGYSHWISLNATMPFATLKIGNNHLVLSYLGREFSLPRASISLSPCIGFPTQGLRIHHSIKGLPRTIIFWTFKRIEVQRDLEVMGYEVSECFAL